MNSKVSIIVPIFNGEKYVFKCINSLLKQTYSNIEIIVVNDGSTDNSLNELLQFDDPRLKITSIPNGGVSNARNVGLKACKGDFIMFVDVDDYIERTTIKKLIKLIDQYNVDIIRFNGYIENAKHEFNEIEFDCVNNYIVDSNDNLEIINMFNKETALRCYTPLLFMKNDRIVPFNTNLCYLEDKLFYLENLTVSNKKVLFNNSCFYYYTYNLSSVTKSDGDIKKKFKAIFDASKEIKKFVKKHKIDSSVIDQSIGLLVLNRIHFYAKSMNFSNFKLLCKYTKQLENYSLKKGKMFKNNIQIILYNRNLYLLLYLLYRIK